MDRGMVFCCLLRYIAAEHRGEVGEFHPAELRNFSSFLEYRVDRDKTYNSGTL